MFTALYKLVIKTLKRNIVLYKYTIGDYYLYYTNDAVNEGILRPKYYKYGLTVRQKYETFNCNMNIFVKYILSN